MSNVLRQSDAHSAVARQILVVGVGSPHGDDQAGWRVVQTLSRDVMEGVEFQSARSPSDLLDWIDAAAHLIVVDACRGLEKVGRVQRWTWPAPELERLMWSGTDDLGLCTVLELGEQLGRLPKHVTIWSIHGLQSEAYQPMCQDVETSVDIAAEMIRKQCLLLLTTKE